MNGGWFAAAVVAAVLFCANPGQAQTYGDEQIADFVESRPAVREIMYVGEELYEFMEKSFMGAYTSVPLAWDPSEPNDNAYAEHKPSVDRKVINVRVSSALSPLDQVACLVYEATNAQNEEQFAFITRQANQGELTKIEFIHSILRLEHQSLKRTLAFLGRQPQYLNPDMEENVFYQKMSGTPEAFEDFLVYLKKIKRDNYDVFEHYSSFYDFVIPPAKKWQARKAAAETKKTAVGQPVGTESKHIEAASSN